MILFDRRNPIQKIEMGNEESYPNVDPQTDVLTVKDQNLKKIPFNIPSDNKIHAADLQGNQIESLPDTLKDLVSICLSRNGYVKVPKSILDYMTTLNNLKYFDFSNNLLKEIPLQVQQMTKLKKISFLNNKITEVNNLPDGLEGIELGQNQITTLPTIPSHLEILSLNFNLLEVIDRGYINLKKIYLNMNRIKEIKPTLVFPNLVTLEISKNELKELPDLSVITPQLQRLDASVNYLEQFPKLPLSIVDVCLTKNNITAIPESIKNYPNLLKLSIEKNLIKSVPTLPSQIQYVLLSLNQITSITEQSLPNLTQLVVSKNRIGSIPSIKDTNLKECLLWRNWIKNIQIDFLSKKITKVNLSENRIEELPENFFSSLPNLTHLYLSKNQITSFPTSIGESKLILLSFSENPIEKFPEKLPDTLHILYCAFCGLKELPLYISELPGLKSIDASGNQLKVFMNLNKDSVPQNIQPEDQDSDSESENSSQFFPALEKLYLSSNLIKDFPTYLPRSLAILDLSQNKIKEIPDETAKQLPNLVDFSLSYNKLDKLPDDFRFSFMTSLKIDHNVSLTASLDISHFRKLRNLDITCTRNVSLNNMNLQDPEKSIQEIITSDVKYKDEDSPVFKFICPENIGIFVGYAEMCGPRPTMEDSIVVRPNMINGIDLYAVFDGHNGSTTSNFCAHEIVKYFTETTTNEKQSNDSSSSFSLKNLIFKSKSSETTKVPDNVFSEEYCTYVCASLQSSLNGMPHKDGSTVAIALVKNNEIIVSHLGDTRVLIVKQSGEVKFVTLDHKPQNQDEIRRILDCGGKIVNGRLDGIIAMSRSIGDFDVVGLGRQPDNTRISIEEDDRWLILACDGLFDVMTNSEVGTIASTASSPVDLAYLYRNIAHSRHSLDNVSVIAVDLSKKSKESQDPIEK